MAQNGDKAANTFRGNFVTGIVRGLESGMRDTEPKAGKALSDGFGEGLKGVSGNLKTVTSSLGELGLETEGLTGPPGRGSRARWAN